MIDRTMIDSERDFIHTGTLLVFAVVTNAVAINSAFLFIGTFHTFETTTVHISLILIFLLIIAISI